MRPRSMTGFGRGEAGDSDHSWTVEVRTVNHRFLDQRIIMPRAYAALEERVKKQVAAHQERGRVEVTFGVQGHSPTSPVLSVDLHLAAQYQACLEQLARRLGRADSVSLTHMLTLRDLVTVQEQTPDLDAEWEIMAQALAQALTACTAMREQEGASLKAELLARLDGFSSQVGQIRNAIPEIVHQRQEELKSRVLKLLDGLDVDPMRLSQECALLADKCDVTEEIVRLESHIGQFRGFLESDEPVGRRLDFLLQEFLREVNTLVSKISSGTVAHLGVEMKNEIEKLREQVQNIE